MYNRRVLETKSQRLNRETFEDILSKPSEGPVKIDESGFSLYSYEELVRRNHYKKFDDIQKYQLYKYMIDSDFEERFGCTKVWSR